MYTKDRTIEIRKRCDAFLKEHGLRMELQRIWGRYHVSFEGDDYRSPVTIVFDGPSKELTEARWDHSRIEIQSFHVEALGDTDWKVYHSVHVGIETSEDFEDLDEPFIGGMLERASHWIERTPLVPNRKGLPGVIDSKALEDTYHDVMTRLPEARNLAVAKDADGEAIEFDMNGWQCKVTFIPADLEKETPERALVQVDGAAGCETDAETSKIFTTLAHLCTRLSSSKHAGPVR